jgi:hypothetical protein
MAQHDPFRVIKDYGYMLDMGKPEFERKRQRLIFYRYQERSRKLFERLKMWRKG